LQKRGVLEKGRGRKYLLFGSSGKAAVGDLEDEVPDAGGYVVHVGLYV